MKECEIYQQDLADYVNKKLSAQEEKGLLLHLADCLACQRELKEIEATLLLFQKEREEEHSEAFWAGFAAEVREKIQSKKEKVPIFKPGWVLIPVGILLVLFVAASLFKVDQRFLSQKERQTGGRLVWLESQASQKSFDQELEQSLENLSQEVEKIYWQDEDIVTLLAELNEEQFQKLEEKVKKLNL